MKKFNKTSAIILWILLGGLFLPNKISAQHVEISESPAIANMMNNWAAANRRKPEISGWRVQIFSSTDRKKIEEEKVRFQTRFPNVPVDWVHDRPYYKLQAGAFRTKREALAAIVEWQTFWTGLYPAKDTKIHPSDFLKK